MGIYKHSKFKNTGILFELMIRQLVSDTLSKKNSGIKEMLFKYFKKNTELAKELEFYKMVLESKNSNDIILTKQIEYYITERNNLDLIKLNKEKYNLLGDLKKRFDLNDFFNSKLVEYKKLANIYKLFEYNISQSPAEYLSTFSNLISELKITSNSPLYEEIQELQNQPKQIKEYALQFLIEKFNEKYENILPKQKLLLQKYITEPISSLNFKNYIFQEISELRKQLIGKKVNDNIRKIKLKEVISLLENMIAVKSFNDNHLNALLKYYELVEVI